MSSDLNIYKDLTISDLNRVEPSPITVLEPSFLVYNKDLNIIIDTKRKQAITTSTFKNLRTYLNDYHGSYIKTITKAKYKEILESIDALNAYKYTDVKDIEPNYYYFKDIPIQFIGFKCPYDNYITLSSQTIKRYILANYKDTSTKKSKNAKSNYIKNFPICILYPTLKRGIFIPKLPTITGISRGLTSSIDLSRENSPSIGDITTLRDRMSNYLTKENTIKESTSRLVKATNKELEPFFKVTSFNLFIEGKNLDYLLEDLDTLDLDKDKFLFYIYNFIIDLGYRLISLIVTLPREYRIALREGVTLDKIDTSRGLEFKSLEDRTKRTYFKYFSLYIIYTLRLYRKVKDNSYLYPLEPILNSTIKAVSYTHLTLPTKRIV